MQIQEIMTTPAVICGTNDTLDRAAQLMWENDSGAIPVVDGNGRLAGMVTDRDIAMSAYTQGRVLRDIPVSTAMARQVFACHPGDSLDAAERLMSDKQIRRVPVVDDEERPIGLVSVNDLARHAVATRRKNGALREVVQTLAAICRPHRRAERAAETRGEQRPAAPM